MGLPKMDPTQPEQPDLAGDNLNWLEVVRQHVASLRYGTVEIVVHDRRVVEIDKTERVRLAKPDAVSRSGKEEHR